MKKVMAGKTEAFVIENNSSTYSTIHQKKENCVCMFMSVCE